MNDFNTVTFLGITLDINPVAFTLPIGGGYDVYWYGIVIALGFFLAVLYAFKNARKLNIDPDRLTDGILITTPIAVLCARAYYMLFYSPKTFFTDFFKIHDGGLAIYGAVIGAVIGLIVSAKTRKLKIIDCLDIMAPGFLIGQGIGRWGNFFNQEAFGINTDLPWGMYSEGPTGTYERILQMGDYNLDATKPVHPCFFYEFLLCLIGFILLNYLVKHRKFRGQLALTYGMWYGTGRFFIELLRTDSLMLGNIRVSALLSACAVVVSCALYIYFNGKVTKNEEYTLQFGNENSLTVADTLEVGEKSTINDLES